MAFADVFYAYDFGKPQSEARQVFFCNHNRHNEFNLNLGLLRLSATHTKWRANLALQAGTYVQDNYAAEAPALRPISEANVGLSLHKSNKLWLDAGILPSHIGFESAISLDNVVLTRSILAENTPYFLTGARLTYTPTSRLTVMGLICNGWQRIKRLDGNSLPAFGTQVNYRHSDAFTFNWSTFVCSERPDSLRQMRYFQNLYALGSIKKFQYVVGFDIGIQQIAPHSRRYEPWYSPVLILAYNWHERWRTALRAEYYHTPDGFVVPVPVDEVFRAFSTSLGVDYRFSPDIALRFEGRYLHNQDKKFIDASGNPSAHNFFLTVSLAARFCR